MAKSTCLAGGERDAACERGVTRAAARVLLPLAERELSLELQGPAIVQGEPGRLRQLLSNLITNALQFSPAGSVISLGLQRQAKSLLIWVEDQGPGVPEQQREQIFERFWQADRSRSGSNAGMGLAIARSIGQAHGGSLSAKEGAQGGCRIELLLPAA